MTPEQERIHQEKVARLAEKKSNGKNKEVFTLITLATGIFTIAIVALGSLIYAIKTNNPHRPQAEALKIQNMTYEEAKRINPNLR